MKKFALIGHNIRNSLSPALFSAAYKSADFSYGLIDDISVINAFKKFCENNYAGANVTSPHKESILPFCTKTDEVTKYIGATNLILKDGGEIFARNTDYQGVKQPLIKRTLIGGNALIVGAGGAAKASVVALKELNYSITITNRTAQKAKEIASLFSINWCEIDDLPSLLLQPHTIVYTIDAPICKIASTNHINNIIFEANYKTPNLNTIECKEYISGREWLFFQAIESFRLFTGINPDTNGMYDLIDNC